MKKLLVFLFILVCAFSSVCSAKGYWTAVAPTAREDGLYHLIDRPMAGETEMAIWRTSEGPYDIYFFLRHVMCSDDGDEIIIPARMFRMSHMGNEYVFALVKYRYSTREARYVILKTVKSTDRVPSNSDFKESRIVRGGNASFWVGPIERSNEAILKEWRKMMDKNKLKRYEFVED